MYSSKYGPLAIVLAVLLVATGCPRETDPTVDQVAIEAPAVAAVHPVEQMHSSLGTLVQAQAEFHQDHGRFAEDLGILIDEYGFAPVGDATVTLHFEGTAPQHGYIARAVHPNVAEQCEVHHGETVPEGEQFRGEIVCAEQ